MDFIKNIKDIVLETNFKMTIFLDKIDILNYTSIGHFDNNKVIVRHESGEVIIKGQNLVVSKLMNDEVLVKGKIQNIELR